MVLFLAPRTNRCRQAGAPKGCLGSIRYSGRGRTAKALRTVAGRLGDVLAPHSAERE